MRKQNQQLSSFLIAVVSLTAILAIWCGAAAAFQFQVYGKIGEKWQKLGRERGPLGAPRSGEAAAPHGGRFNDFAHGSIWWHPTIGEAYGVWGLIGVKYRQLSGANFGYPITDELTTSDGVGRFNHFRAVHLPGRPEASIYWTPSTGAHELYGDIRKAWAAQGWERGKLGYPTSGEFQDGPTRRVNFQNGYITWSAQRGASVSLNTPSPQVGGPPSFDTSTYGQVNGLALALERGGQVLASNGNFLAPGSLCGYGNKQQALNDLVLRMVHMINSSGRLPRGVQIVRHEARISPGCTALASYHNQVINLKARLPRNVVLFNLTTPSPLGQWADPRFSIDFDLGASAELRIPATTAEGLSLGPAQATVSHIKLDSQNATGDIALAVTRIVEFFSGRDFTGMLTKDQRFSLGEVSLGLGRFNQALSGLGRLYLVPELDPRTRLLTLYASERLPSGPVVK